MAIVRLRSGSTGQFMSLSQAEMARGARVELYYSTNKVPQFIGQATTAFGESVLEMAAEAVERAKDFESTYAKTGTLMRSIHSAPTGYLGDADEGNATVDDIPNATFADLDWSEASIVQLKAGSWLPYACVQEVAMRNSFITPAIEMLRTSSDVIVARVTKENGL